MSVTQPVPALFAHCQEVYRAMDRATETEIIDGVPAKVWTGYTTKLFRKLDLSVPYYSSIKHALETMDCIRQYQRGGGGSPSKWIMVQVPTPELWDSKNLTDVMRARRTGGKNAVTQSQQQRDLSGRVAELEKQIPILMNAMAGLQAMIDELTGGTIYEDEVLGATPDPVDTEPQEDIDVGSTSTAQDVGTVLMATGGIETNG